MAVRLLMRSIVDAGEVDARIRERNVLPFLEGISQALGMLFGRPPETLRLPIQSVIFLVVRYAISHEAEHALLVENNCTTDTTGTGISIVCSGASVKTELGVSVNTADVTITYTSDSGTNTATITYSP